MTLPKPEQYFATPVPMSTAEFNQFLKENLLDVKSVTLPFSDTNQYEDILEAKKKEYVQSPKAISRKIDSVVRTLKNMPLKISGKLTDDIDTEQEFEMLEDLESNLENDNDDVKVQRKRMGGNSKENLVNFHDYAINQQILEEFKRKLKLFDNKKEKYVNKTDPEDLDVTVIDINYGKDASNEDANMAKLSESFDAKMKSGISENVTEPASTKTLEKPGEVYTMHNKLLYEPGKNIFSQIQQQDFTGRSNPDRFSQMFNKNVMVDNKVGDKLQLMGEKTFGEMILDKKDDTEFGQDVTTYTPDTKQADLPKLFQILSKMPNLKENRQPTRIMMSSHSYKYNVFYKGLDVTTKPSNNSK